MHSASKLNRVFGEQLRTARRAVHLTQEQLAYCAQLCRALDLPPETLLAHVHEHLVQRELNHPTKDQ